MIGMSGIGGKQNFINFTDILQMSDSYTKGNYADC